MGVTCSGVFSIQKGKTSFDVHRLAVNTYFSSDLMKPWWTWEIRTPDPLVANLNRLCILLVCLALTCIVEGNITRFSGHFVPSCSHFSTSG